MGIIFCKPVTNIPQFVQLAPFILLDYNILLVVSAVWQA
jgi:hypothetical protein